MCLKFSALLGCQLWEKGLSVTNPVFFVPVCGGENLAWHQMPLNRCFSKLRQKKKKKWPASSSAPPPPPLVSDPVAMVSAPAWGRTCVYCIYYGMLRKERADWSAGALWCHIQVCETLCVFNATGSRLLFSGKCWEQEAIWRDGHHNSNSNWMGCSMNAPWPRAYGQTTWVYFCLLCVKTAHNRTIGTKPPLKVEQIPMKL